MLSEDYGFDMKAWIDLRVCLCFSAWVFMLSLLHTQYSPLELVFLLPSSPPSFFSGDRATSSTSKC